MEVHRAQAEMRRVYLGGAVGQAVSGIIWLASAACWKFASPRAGIIVLVVAGMFIYPLTQAGLQIIRGADALSAANPLRELAMEVAFIVPLLLPVVGAASVHRIEWFYPAMMMVVGAHYLPFAFLYGMRDFLALAAMLVVAGLLIGAYAPASAVYGAVVTGAAMVAFVPLGRSAARRR